MITLLGKRDDPSNIFLSAKQTLVIVNGDDLRPSQRDGTVQFALIGDTTSASETLRVDPVAHFFGVVVIAVPNTVATQHHTKVEPFA